MLELGKEITTIGGWSTLYRVKDRPDLCAKVLARHRVYKGGLPDPDMIARKKYGITDMLQYEWDNYRAILERIPEHYHGFFVQIYGIESLANGAKALIMECVRDNQGNIAKNLDENRVPLEPAFFHNLEMLRKEVFLKYSIDHFGVACRNILVRDPATPVLIDFQNTKQRYKYQFWLHIPWFVRQKMNRRFQRVYKDLNQDIRALGNNDRKRPLTPR
ncbi:MAG: hypothetical protein CSA26_01355 [Desulfobacterales bacterium]|nr:MAG: hypothetical protein CSA26_01355 [Desulfobacterales bacterium]